MRVIGGEARGRRLESPRGRSLRPTSDRVREAIFSIVAAQVAGSAFLDLFAGTGAVGIEALSRGASTAVFVERAAAHAELVRRNLRACGLQDRARVLALPVARALRKLAGEEARFALVYVDPPYDAPEERRRALDGLVGGGLLEPGARVMVEGPSRQAPEPSQGLEVTRVARYGDTSVSFYRAGSVSG